MKITRISVWQRDLPLEEPYFLSGGRLRFDQLDTTFVQLETDAGVEGWGEACPGGPSSSRPWSGRPCCDRSTCRTVLGADPRRLMR